MCAHAQSPTPWSREGKKIVKKLGLTIQYPDGYLEAQAAKQRSKEGEGSGGAGSEDETETKGKRGRKRKATGERGKG